MSSSEISAETISRRAYEIWEREGRPEGADLRHWLQAEQELRARRSEPANDSDTLNLSSNASTPTATPVNTGIDTPRAQPPGRTPNRDSRRASRSPFGGNNQSGKRKSTNAPLM